MAPRITKSDLLTSLSHHQEEATRLRWFIRHIAPPTGFHFVSSPRGLQGLLFFVDDDDSVSIFDVTMPNSLLEAELWRLHQDGPHLESLMEALQEARKYRAAHLPSANPHRPAAR